MRLTRLTTITPDKLLSTSLPEDTLPEWSAGTTYALGYVVQIASVHKEYESLAEMNVGNDPTDAVASLTKWRYIQPTNRWRMFDDLPDSRSEAFETMTATVRPGTINAASFINMSADMLRLQMTSDVDGVVFDEMIDLTADITSPDWYHFFFDPVKRRSDIIVEDLPAHNDCDVKFTLTAADGETVALGLAAFGIQADLGQLQWGASIGGTDFSKKDFDEYGRLKLIRRTFSQNLEGTTVVEPENVDALHQVMKENRAVLLVWNGNNDDNLFQSFIIYGFYRDYKIKVNETLAWMDIEIEGMTSA